MGHTGKVELLTTEKKKKRTSSKKTINGSDTETVRIRRGRMRWFKP